MKNVTNTPKYTWVCARIITLFSARKYRMATHQAQVTFFRTTKICSRDCGLTILDIDKRIIVFRTKPDFWGKYYKKNLSFRHSS